MPNYTENYNLILPNKSENYNVETANINNIIIDAQLKNRVEKVPGRGLSEQNFTKEYKAKIDSLKNLQTLYKFKGKVEDYAEIQAKVEPKLGDTWYCIADKKHYSFNGQEWVEIDLLIDLEGFTTFEDLDTFFTEYRLNITQNIADNSEITIPCYYKVGNDSLTVIFNGEVLLKATDTLDGHYEEVGTTGSISNKIKIHQWGCSAESGDVFKFLVRGDYNVDTEQ